MKLIIGLVGSIIGGLVGAGIWALIAYYAHVEIAWIAIGVGALAGVGMALGVKHDGNFVSGALAAVVAIFALAAGKYMTVELVLNHAMKEANTQSHYTVDDEKAQLFMAEQLIAEAQAGGKNLAWPGGKEPEEGVESSKDVPKDIWKDVQARWNAMEQPARTQYVASVQTQYDQMLAKGMDMVRKEGFFSSFDAIDVVFFLVALCTAYRCGAGLFDEN